MCCNMLTYQVRMQAKITSFKKLPGHLLAVIVSCPKINWISKNSNFKF